ncbi:DUF1003 domain-containing protein [Anabaena cylindrica UHCC 0172]|uniref:DUF1003 domain-containing protein n=1 Tax=Anabaena cylindrica TaxID=1165 RepID=UPI002B1F9698|nr:DUF1003 domain-containing protein [Anabaena cylindrica]MEA5549990.1 DUF1003 domain-containing protein [Anabaena cylindrica UHCC 0172]
MQKKPLRARVSTEEYKLLQHLRDRKPAQNPPKFPGTLGDRLADKVVDTVGSWRFIIIQSTLLLLWIIFNVTAYVNHWDPYPFILLNLMLSFQAAYTAPIIMMSQTRQATIDRQDAKYDYEVNKKAELEIELLHDKMNLLREDEIFEITRLLKAHQEQLHLIESKLSEISARIIDN